MLIFKILAAVFLIPGLIMVFGARSIVNRYNLQKNVKCDFEHEMNESELTQYKCTRALVNVKMLGMLVALPGFIFILIAFR